MSRLVVDTAGAKDKDVGRPKRINRGRLSPLWAALLQVKTSGLIGWTAGGMEPRVGSRA